MEEKKSSNKIIILLLVFVIGGFVVLFCGGILAAIAIPSFVKYTQKSKEVEAQQLTRQMADYAKIAYQETCTFPGALPPTTDPAECCGGEKCSPVGAPPEIWAANVSSVWQPTYFSYAVVPSGPDKLTIIAEADFQCGGPRHTMTIDVIGTKQGSECDASASAPVTNNEFE